MKKITLLTIFALLATFGFSQKNILIHKSFGPVYKWNATGVDSITFANLATKGTFVMDSYTDTTIIMNSHSKTTWNASYKGNNADIPGGFDVSEMFLKFDETNPANIKFDGRVKLSTTNTFEPGRDAPGKCVNTSMGVVWTGSYKDTTYRIVGGNITDTIVTTVYPTDSLDDSKNWATLSAAAGKVVAYGDDYLATADFTLKGVTTQVPVLLKYVGTKAQTATRDFHNFMAYFTFNAGATSSDQYYLGGNIKSDVRVQINCVFQQDK